VSKDNKTGTNTNMLLGCLFFVATDCASSLYTSVDAHGAGASAVPYNSLAVVNLRPCLVKKISHKKTLPQGLLSLVPNAHF